MHPLRQPLLHLLRHRLLRYLGHGTLARGMALRSGKAGVVDLIRDGLFDALGELFLEDLGDYAGAGGVGLVGSLGHGCWGWGVVVRMGGWVGLIDIWMGGMDLDGFVIVIVIVGGECVV